LIDPRLLFSLFKPRGMLNIVMALLGVGILVLFDTLATMIVASWIGAYLALAVSAISVWVSLFLMWSSLVRYRKRVMQKVRQAHFPEMEFMHLSALMVSVILVAIPGFVTDILAWVIFFTPIRLLAGAIIVRLNREDFVTVYQHLQASAE